MVKMKNGHYKVQKMKNGARLCVTFDHRPTKLEIEDAFEEKFQKLKEVEEKKRKISFGAAAAQYVEMKRNVLSPSTVAGYESLIRRLSDDFKSLSVDDITRTNVQVEINAFSAGRSAKTVRNAHGFISAVLDMYRPELQLHTTLPQKKKVEKYIPSEEDISALFEKAKGTKYEIAFLLCAQGLRRSEVCALLPSDLSGNLLTIDKAMVQDSNREWKIKTTKTLAGTRTVYVDDDVAEMIRSCEADKPVYKGTPHMIYKTLCAWQKELGQRHYRLHDLRHFFASVAHANGVPDSYIMAAGGWKSDAVLKSVYRHAMEGKKDEMDRKMTGLISSLRTGK